MCDIVVIVIEVVSAVEEGVLSIARTEQVLKTRPRLPVHSIEGMRPRN